MAVVLSKSADRAVALNDEEIAAISWVTSSRIPLPLERVDLLDARSVAAAAAVGVVSLSARGIGGADDGSLDLVRAIFTWRMPLVFAPPARGSNGGSLRLALLVEGMSETAVSWSLLPGGFHEVAAIDKQGAITHIDEVLAAPDMQGARIWVQLSDESVLAAQCLADGLWTFSNNTGRSHRLDQTGLLCRVHEGLEA